MIILFSEILSWEILTVNVSYSWIFVAYIYMDIYLGERRRPENNIIDFFLGIYIEWDS